MATFDNSSTSEDVFDEIIKVILYRTLSHRCSIVTEGKFEVASVDNPKEYGYWFLRLTSYTYIIQEDVSIYGIIVEMGEQGANSCYKYFWDRVTSDM